MHNGRMLTGIDIEERRKLKGWSQQALADKIGVDQGTISKWEMQRTKPSGPAKKMLESLFSSNDEKESAA